MLVCLPVSIIAGCQCRWPTLKLPRRFACSRVRDLAEVDETVVLLVDTRSPGWTVLYTSTGFEALTGVPREAALGATLNEVCVGLR